MRGLISREKLRSFMAELARSADVEGRVYLTGGCSAVLLGWRESTVDVDLSLAPERDALLRAIPAIKERLKVNVELAAPSQFIPELPGWEERSPYIATHARLHFHHYDFYSQALSKIERGHEQDLADAHAMLAEGLVEPGRLRELFSAIVPELFRYPALDPTSFEAALEDFLEKASS